MLRRKLMLMLGPLLILVLGLGMLAIILLGGILEELTDLGSGALRRGAATASFEDAATSLEAGLRAQARDPDRPASHLLDEMQVLRTHLESLHVSSEPESRSERVDAAVVDLQIHLDELAEGGGGAPAGAALDALQGVREAVSDGNAEAQAVAEQRHAALTARFRWSLLGLGLAFVLVINVSVVLLLRAATMILRPVEELVDASRHLAREEFEHRVRILQHDEFGELAAATNSLAEQLERNEARKVETLHQVARAMSHELNNALAVVELQLEIVARRAATGAELESNLRQIHDALNRLSRAVTTLTRVRRIVLTDYLQGVPMLDLERSAVES